MKISSILEPSRKGSVVYVNSRHGKVGRQYARPRNPRTSEQQAHRQNVRAVSGRWRTLTSQQRSAWCIATAKKYYGAVRGNYRGVSRRQEEVGAKPAGVDPAGPFEPGCRSSQAAAIALIRRPAGRRASLNGRHWERLKGKTVGRLVGIVTAAEDRVAVHPGGQAA